MNVNSFFFLAPTIIIFTAAVSATCPYDETALIMLAKGDGTCDDILNIELCEYDGGDCCLPEEIDHCHDTDCACHLNENSNMTLTTTTTAITSTSNGNSNITTTTTEAGTQ